MDSMRSLNTSLPSSNARGQRSYPPAGLHQAFKSAAFSVTQLYKEATANQDAARSSGYQEAIDELLAFLDKENLGLCDGEGWQVRQWATARLTPDAYASETETDEQDDVTIIPTNAMNTEPIVEEAATRAQEPPTHDAPRHDISPTRPTSTEIPKPQDIFQFTANTQTNPQHQPHHTQPAEVEMTVTPEKHTLSPRSVRLNLRPPQSLFRRTSRDPTTSAGVITPLGLGAGAKRRSPSHSHSDFDFATFANYGHGFGGLGGAKRRRRGD